jgi:hypothetical protein
MLFRIQSLGFLVVIIAVVLNANIMPFWSYHFPLSPESDMALYGMNFSFGMGSMGVLFYIFNAALVATAVIALIALGLFTKRPTQLMLSYIGLFAALAMTVSAVLAGFAVSTKLGGDTVKSMPSVGFYLMLLAAPMFLLSIYGIRKDDEIANAYKRL